MKQNRTGGRAAVWILGVLFLLGAALVTLGVMGQYAYGGSGFGTETAYEALHLLGTQTEADWKELISPALATLTGEQGEKLATLTEKWLKESAESVKHGSGAELDSLLASREDRRDIAWRMLYIAWKTTGPKVSTAARKALTAEASSDPAGTRTRLLSGAAGEETTLSDGAEKAVGKAEGEDKQRALLQAFFTSFYNESHVDTEAVNNLKRSLADDPTMAVEAWRMVTLQESSWFRNFCIAQSRILILVGALLALDALLLFLLMRWEKTWTFDVKWLIILAIVDFLLIFQVLPLGYMVVKSFFPEGHPTLSIFRNLFRDETGLNQAAIGNTAIAATATMILGTLIAFPLAWLVGRTNMYGRKFFRSLFVMTYMVPPYVGAMAWLRLANPNVGAVNLVLRQIFALGDNPGPLNIYSLPGLIWVLTSFYYPYAFITISRAMEKMDPSLEEASRISGASPMKTLFTVTLPMTLPALISGALLVFVCAASCYGIPSIIGSPGRVHTITTRIVEYVALGQDRLNDATGMAVLLMVTSLLLLLISDLVTSRKQYITVSGKSVRPAIVDLRKWRVPVTVAVALFAGVIILLPFITITVTSFKINVGDSVFAPGNFTLNNWTTVFGRAEILASLQNSLIYGVVTATVGILVACAMSYLLQRTRIRGRSIPNFLITLGSGTPSVVIALGLIMTMKGNFGINIYSTAWILITAYLVKYMMMGMRTVVSAMSQIHVSLEECSQVSGASWLRTMRKITGPLISPSIAAGWFLIFIPSFYELSMTTLLYSNTTKTIGLELYEYWTYTSQTMSCAMACGILLFVALMNFILNRLTKGEFSL